MRSTTCAPRHARAAGPCAPAGIHEPDPLRRVVSSIAHRRRSRGADPVAGDVTARRRRNRSLTNAETKTPPGASLPGAFVVPREIGVGPISPACRSDRLRVLACVQAKHRRIAFEANARAHARVGGMDLHGKHVSKNRVDDAKGAHHTPRNQEVQVSRADFIRVAAPAARRSRRHRRRPRVRSSQPPAPGTTPAAGARSCATR